MRSLDDFAAVRCSQSQRGIDAVDPDVWKEARLAGDGSTGYPGAAHVSRGVIEAWMSTVSASDVPAEYLLVKGNRLA